MAVQQWFIRLKNGDIKPVSSILDLKDKDQEHTFDIAKTEFEDGSHVSTIFTHLNLNPTDGIPILFETLVFGGILDGEMQRYATEAEARQGHREMVELIRSKGEWKLP